MNCSIAQFFYLFLFRPVSIIVGGITEIPFSRMLIQFFSITNSIKPSYSGISISRKHFAFVFLGGVCCIFSALLLIKLCLQPEAGEM